MVTLALVIPAFAFYPTVFQLAWRAKTQLIESRLVAQAINQRETVKALLQQTLDQIDGFTTLADVVSGPEPAANESPETDRAFDVWRATSLASPITSSIELYAPGGALVSRF